MHRGPLLAYLLADPELSLQSILITNSVIGRGKTAVYVVLVTIFSTLSGLLFGAWVNGANAWWIAGGSVAGVAALIALGSLVERWLRRRKSVAAERRSVA
jgi:hypothetical protein